MTDMGPLASAAAQRAIDLDDKLPKAHVSLGLVKAFHEWAWADADREFSRAIELKPSCADAHHWYSYDVCLLRLSQKSWLWFGFHQHEIGEVFEDPVVFE